MKKKLLCIVLILFFSIPFYAQKVSEKKDIAVFAVSYQGWYIPNELIDMIDDSVMNVFFNLQRFNIIGLEYRLASNDVDTFNEIIKQARESDTPLPEAVLMGLEAFTKEDWEKTVNSYYVVTPIIKDYSIQQGTFPHILFGEIEGYRVRLNLQFNVYSSKEDINEQFDIEISATESSYDNAFTSALTVLSDELDLELRKNKAFTIKTGIIKAEKGTVHFELGKAMGVKLGDEYVILSGDGQKEMGLIVVTETQKDFSKGLVLYSQTSLNLGEPIKEVPHGPFEYRTYTLAELGFRNLKDLYDGAVSIGVHASSTRGFYRIRPCFGAEVNLDSQFIEAFHLGIPVSLSIGSEIGNTYFKRLQILPTVQFYYTMAVTNIKRSFPIPLGAGGRAFVHTSFLVTKNFKIGTDLGIKAGAVLYPQLGFSIRLTAGIGLTFKF